MLGEEFLSCSRLGSDGWSLLAAAYCPQAPDSGRNFSGWAPQLTSPSPHCCLLSHHTLVTSRRVHILLFSKAKLVSSPPMPSLGTKEDAPRVIRHAEAPMHARI
jgi:hypothetical protein